MGGAAVTAGADAGIVAAGPHLRRAPGLMPLSLRGRLKLKAKFRDKGDHT